MWRCRSLVVGAAAVLITGCAGPGPAGPPADVPDTAAASPAVPVPVAPAIPVPPRSSEASCALGAMPVPSEDPSASFDLNDPEQRARRALAEHRRRPSPTRGVVPDVAIPGAEACVDFVKMQFSLLTAGSRTVPDERTVEPLLRYAGLTNIVVRPGPAFAASTGAACIYGDFTATGLAYVLGPPAEDGSCPT